MQDVSSISLALIGSGGAGALTAGDVLLEAAGAGGWHGFATRTLGPQIRGGEAAALLRLATHPVECLSDVFDIVIGIDWLNAHRFGAEIQAGPGSLIIGDPEAGEPPPILRDSGAKFVNMPLKEIASAIPGGRANMVALGVAARMSGFSPEQMFGPIEKRLAEKGDAAIESSRAGIRAGYDSSRWITVERKLAPPPAAGGKRWLLSGNEAAALGAMRGGIRFAAAYPITPATEILEWLAPSLARAGGTLLQAEDELAAVNMIIGASYGGTPSLTATSGPGLSLMIEALGLATAAEIPIVVVDVMRGGPSTGIPTKSEQTDLNIAVYGLHGDAPHLVLAPQSVADCLFTMQWATYLAETLQAPAIVLSDQFMGQSRAAIPRPADVAFIGSRAVVRELNGAYKRYAATANGVSPMGLPGTRGGQYTADGLTHTERGTPTSGAAEHQAQLDKRRDKLEQFNFGSHWATLEGEGEVAVLTWGSVTGAAREAIARVREEGVAVRLIAPRLLSPVRPRDMQAALEGVKRVLIIEQSHSGQFHRYLRAHYEFETDVQVFHRAGPLPITAGEIRNAILQGR